MKGFVAQAFLPVWFSTRRAGPRPFIKRSDQAGRNGVSLYISNDPVPLFRVLYPPIITFILPKWFARAVQYLIGCTSGKSFNRLRDFWKGRVRLDDDVNVVRHHAECNKIIELEVPVAESKGIYNAL